jgi:hypothetical protein
MGESQSRKVNGWTDTLSSVKEMPRLTGMSLVVFHYSLVAGLIAKREAGIVTPTRVDDDAKLSGVVCELQLRDRG